MPSGGASGQGGAVAITPGTEATTITTEPGPAAPASAGLPPPVALAGPRDPARPIRFIRPSAALTRAREAGSGRVPRRCQPRSSHGARGADLLPQDVGVT